jgi:hypothetical protein
MVAFNNADHTKHSDVPGPGDLNAKKPVEPPDSFMDKMKGGAQADARLALGIPMGFGAGIADMFGANKTRDYLDKKLQDWTPVNHAGQQQLEKFANFMDESKLGGLAPEMGMAPKLASEARIAAPAIPGQVARMASEAPGQIGRSIDKVGKALTPTIAPETLDLARKAQAAGIPLRPDMLTNSRIMRMVGDTLEQVPLSGNKGAARQSEFNRAAAETIGADTTTGKITPDVFLKAINENGEKIGELSEKYSIPANAKLNSDLDGIVHNAEFETADTARPVMKYVNEIKSKMNSDGVIDGTTFRKIRTQLTAQMRRSQNADVTHALSEIDDVMLDHIQAQLKPEELEDFNKARMQYRNAKVLEPIVAKGDGNISPGALMARVTATGQGKAQMAKGTGGDLGDLARIGQKFLNEPPTQKQMAYGVLGELGTGIIAPGKTAGVVGAANAYNRAAPWLANKMMGPPPLAKATKAATPAVAPTIEAAAIPAKFRSEVEKSRAVRDAEKFNMPPGRKLREWYYSDENPNNPLK